MLAVFNWVMAFLVVMPFVEYVSHRWFMHRPAFGKNHSVYRNHHVEHHAWGMNGPVHVHMNMFQKNNFLSSMTMIVLAGAAGWAIAGPPRAAVAAATWFVCLNIYGGIWSILHRAEHELELRLPWSQWVVNSRYGRAAIEHHRLHHKRPYANYGTVFIFTDRLFGTKYEKETT